MNKICALFLLLLSSWSYAVEYSIQFEEAQARFNSPDQTESIPMFQKFIVSLETKAQQEGLNEKELSLLTSSYNLLGQAQFNNNDQAGASAAFLELLKWNPDYELDEDLVSKKIIDLLSEIKRDNLVLLTVRSIPEGAMVLLDGRNLGSTNLENQYILKGKHKLEVRLTGYQPQMTEIEIPAGSMKEISVQFAKNPAN
jgi:hypothetical protein